MYHITRFFDYFYALLYQFFPSLNFLFSLFSFSLSGSPSPGVDLEGGEGPHREGIRFEEFGMRRELKTSEYRGRYERGELGGKGELEERGEEESTERREKYEHTDRSESSEDNWRDVSEKEIYSRQFLGPKCTEKSPETSPTIEACDAINLLLNDHDNIYNKYHDNIENYKNNEGVRNSEMSEGDIYIQNLATLADYCEEKLGGDEKERKERQEYEERREGKERKEGRERGERGGRMIIEPECDSITNENNNKTDEKTILDELEARKKFVIRKWAMEEKCEFEIIDEISEALKNERKVKKHEISNKCDNEYDDEYENKDVKDKYMGDKKDYEERIYDRHVKTSGESNTKKQYNNTASDDNNNENTTKNTNEYYISETHSDSSTESFDSEANTGEYGGEYGEYGDYYNGEYGDYYGMSKSALDSGFGSHDEMRGETKEQKPQEISVKNTQNTQNVQNVQNIQNIHSMQNMQKVRNDRNDRIECKSELRKEAKIGGVGVMGVGVIGVKAGDIAYRREGNDSNEEREFHDFNRKRELQDDFIYEARVGRGMPSIMGVRKMTDVTVTANTTVPSVISPVIPVPRGCFSPSKDKLYVHLDPLESFDRRAAANKSLHTQTSPIPQGQGEGESGGQREGEGGALHRAYSEGDVHLRDQYLQRTYSGQGCRKGAVGKKSAGHRSSRYEVHRQSSKNACNIL